MSSWIPKALALPLLLTGLLGSAARAQDCARSGVELFPKPGSVVPTNFRIVLEGIGSDQDRVAALVGKELVLTASDDRVAVRVLRGWKSTVSRTAVILRPRAQLKANREYRLSLEEKLPGARLLGVKSGVASWATGKGRDDKGPKWVDPPAVSEGRYVIRDGQLTRFLKFRMAMQDDSPVYAVMSIRRARGSTSVQTYFVPVSAGEAWVGHDGCSGGFSFDDGRAYFATVEAFDVAGNQAPPVPSIEFQAPRQVNR